MARLTLAAGVLAGVLAAASRPAASQDAPAADSAASIAPVVVTGNTWSSNRFLRADQQRRRVLELMRESRALERQLREHDRTIASLERRLMRARALRDSLDRTAPPVAAEADDAFPLVFPRVDAPRVDARPQRRKGESR